MINVTSSLRRAAKPCGVEATSLGSEARQVLDEALDRIRALLARETERVARR